MILEARDCQAKGMLERLHDFIERSFEPARRFANETDYQDQLDRWFQERANARLHRTLRAVPAERLAKERGPSRSNPIAIGTVHTVITGRAEPFPMLEPWLLRSSESSSSRVLPIGSRIAGLRRSTRGIWRLKARTSRCACEDSAISLT